MGVMEIFWCFSLLAFCLLGVSSAQMPGFVSIDCGGTTNYTDNLGLNWIPDNYQIYGNTATLSNQNQNSKQYTTVRYFPGDNLKYCYTLPVKTRTRYLIRATFLYGNFDNSNVYPSFDISFGATHWSTIEISDANSVEVEELVFLASSPKINVCLSNATTGQPFISTLELRQFNGSLYHTTTEAQFFMSLSARINFGAETTDPVRYPDDPFDRIWESDSVRKPNFLVDVAPGTEKISTITPIDMDSSTEMPPQKVMQTAVVGRNGTLTYRLDLVGFPGNGWAFSYFAEIEDIATDDSRKFRLYIPGIPDISKPIVNVQENAHGKYRVYEPGYYNLSLPFVFSFEFKQTSDSLLGPILNALEIYHYLPINYGSIDASAIASFTSHYASADWANEGGDPCLPASWSWVQCSSDPQPKITSIILSGKNITGVIPSELTKLTGLVTLRLDNNSLSGPIPDFSGCINLQYIHLENNELTGTLPASLADLPNLKELYVQNNMLTGTVPQGLIAKNIILNYSGNMGLHKKNISMSQKTIIILCSCIGVGIILFAVICCLFACKKRESPNRSHKENVASAPHAQKMSAFFSEVATETAHRFSLAEIEEATTKFEKRIGSGGFGIVYYGKLKDGKEIAVKVLTNDSFQGIREFLNEVSLLSKIHHRNLVAFLGYSQQDGKNILVYEFMHNGTLKEHLRGASAKARTLTWIKRLRIAEDSAKGIEYLHTGCSPTIIHRDLKSSNILLDSHMRAKVADFGLSKPQVDGSHVSSIVRGTVGYLDPEYYISQQLTEKSDIYSFGVILLELITGHEPISNENFGANCRNIIAWAKSHIDSGNIQAIIDPLLDEDYDMQSIWKIAEVAITCVKPHGVDRPSISDILKEIQEAIAIERDSIAGAELPEKSKNSMGSSSANMDAAGLATPDRNDAFNSVFGVQPVLR